ncbi:MAG: TIGR03936 family radical SAM-associated protein [Lachnospiraceae bacterium]|nr:TIGR03936 family radical SAM-associated protein [Lachnospiraceae bacterium]
MSDRIKVRIKFSKHGPVKFVGHLDFMRYFQKCIRRAKIDIAYSEGFSPHQIMSFATALGVGVETDGDYLDIEVNSLTSVEDMMEALNKTMAEGVRVENVIILPEGTPNAMSSVAAAEYRLIPKEGGKYPDKVLAAANKVLSAESIVIRKENKKAKKKGRAVEGVNDYIETDVKDRIYKAQISENEFNCLVDASSAGNVRPMSLLELIYNEAGVTLDPISIQIIRCDLYTSVGDKLMPLDGYGA